MKMSPEIKQWYREIGSMGGKKSKRAITPEQQRKMQQARQKGIKLRREGSVR